MKVSNSRPAVGDFLPLNNVSSDLALEDAKINPQQIQMPSSPNEKLFERRSVQSLSKESSSWHSMGRPSLDDVSAQASPRVELNYEPAERGWRAASPSAVPAHIRAPSEAEIKQVQDLDPTHSHESSLWRTIDANTNAVAGPLDNLLQSKGASSEDFLPRDLEGALKMNVLRDSQQPGSSSSASLIYCPHCEFSNIDQGVKEGYFKILGTDEDRKHFTESMASENGPRSEIVGPDEGCGGKEAKEKVGTLGPEEGSEKSEEYEFATPAREETDSLVDGNIHRDKQISSAGSKFPGERTKPTEEAQSLFTPTENNPVDVKQSPATEEQHSNDPKEYHDRDGLSGTGASDLDAEPAEGHGKSGTEDDVVQILNGVEGQRYALDQYPVPAPILTSDFCLVRNHHTCILDIEYRVVTASETA